MPINPALGAVAQPVDDPSLQPALPGSDQDTSDAAGWLAETLSAAETSPTAVQQNLVNRGANSTMGDAIIKGMQSVSDHYAKSVGEFHAVLEEGNESTLSLKGALQMHMSFIEVSMEADVVSKVISKSGQHIDQLVKLQ